MEYGRVMLTVAVFAIIFAAPIGAMIVNILGFAWLQPQKDDPKIDVELATPYVNIPDASSDAGKL
jgi:hypothetical protein